MPRPTIADTVAAILAEHRALSAEDLGERIAELGLTRAKSPTQAVSRALNADRRFRRIGDDRWTVPAQLLDGATLTHRLSANALPPRSHSLIAAIRRATSGEPLFSPTENCLPGRLTCYPSAATRPVTGRPRSSTFPLSELPSLAPFEFPVREKQASSADSDRR